MRKSCFFIICLLVGISAYAQPNMKFDKNGFQMGELEEGVLASHEFRFKNIGNAPVVIKDVTAACGCTLPEWSKEPVMPGQEGTILATFNTRGRLGAFNKKITIISNSKEPSKDIFLWGVVNKAEFMEKKTPMVEYYEKDGLVIHRTDLKAAQKETGKRNLVIGGSQPQITYKEPAATKATVSAEAAAALNAIKAKAAVPSKSAATSKKAAASSVSNQTKEVAQTAINKAKETKSTISKPTVPRRNVSIGSSTAKASGTAKKVEITKASVKSKAEPVIEEVQKKAITEKEKIVDKPEPTAHKASAAPIGKEVAKAVPVEKTAVKTKVIKAPAQPSVTEFRSEKFDEEFSKNEPLVEISNRVINLGKITKGRDVAFQVNFQNLGGADLKIKDFRSSCNCIKLHNSANNIVAPRSSGEFKMIFQPNAEGSYSNVIAFYTNDKSMPVVKVKLIAEVLDTSALSALKRKREAAAGW